MPNYNYQVPSAKYRRRLPYVMTAHEQQSDVRARRKSVCPKFEVEVELELELENGNGNGTLVEQTRLQAPAPG